MKPGESQGTQTIHPRRRANFLGKEEILKHSFTSPVCPRRVSDADPVRIHHPGTRPGRKLGPFPAPIHTIHVRARALGLTLSLLVCPYSPLSR